MHIVGILHVDSVKRIDLLTQETKISMQGNGDPTTIDDFYQNHIGHLKSVILVGQLYCIRAAKGSRPLMKV